MLRGLFTLMPRRGVLLSADTRSCRALAYRTGVLPLPPARLFSSWVLQDHRYEMVDARRFGSRSKTRHENPLRGFWSTNIYQKGSGGPQKPFSWLSEGDRGVFTINTEAGEKTCIPNLHLLGAYDHGGIGPRPRTGPQVGVSDVGVSDMGVSDESSAGISSGGSGLVKW